MGREWFNPSPWPQILMKMWLWPRSKHMKEWRRISGTWMEGVGRILESPDVFFLKTYNTSMGRQSEKHVVSNVFFNEQEIQSKLPKFSFSWFRSNFWWPWCRRWFVLTPQYLCSFKSQGAAPNEDRTKIHEWRSRFLCFGWMKTM